MSTGMEMQESVHGYQAPAAKPPDLRAKVVPSPARLESIVDALGRYGGVTTSLVLRSEALKTVGRALIAQA